LLAWLSLLLFYVVEDLIDGDYDLHGFLLSLSYAMAFAAAFYVFYPFVWNKVINEKKWWILPLFLPIGIAAFVFSRLLLQEVVVKALTGIGNYRDPWQWNYIWDNVYRPIPIILISLVAWLIRRQNRLEADRLKLAGEKTEAELSFLRGQVNPHFLFNSLGFVQSRIYEADPEAAEMVMQLSSILRRALEQEGVDKVELKEEVKLLKDMHGIMKKRFNGDCHLDIHVEEDSLNARIEPLILISLAENMFKHGDLRDPKFPGEVSAQLRAANLELSFRNRIMKGKPHMGSGIGLTNIHRRLELVYADNYRFDYGIERDFFLVKLQIPQS